MPYTLPPETLAYYRRYHPTKYRAVLRRRDAYQKGKARMASRRIAAYPTWMVTLAGEFEPPESIRSKILVFPDAELAKKVRRELYGFITALSNVPEMKYAHPNFQAVRIELRGNELHLRHVDDAIPQPETR